MKPAAFEYHRVHSVEEAIQRLSELGDEAKVLGGGQSLVPMMSFRLVRPEALVDITRIDALRGVERSDGGLRIGALTTHRAIERMGDEFGPGFGVLPHVARLIGHGPIRTRGTIGGSIAHADPAAEWCLLAVALDAFVVARGPRGEREIPAGDFFLGFFSTVLEHDEVVVAVRLPRAWRHAAVEELARRHGDFAIVAAAVALDVEDGRCTDARIVLGGVDDVPRRVPDAERALIGAEISAAAFEEAGRVAAAAIGPTADIHATAEYRRELAAVMVARALERATGGAGEGRR